VAGKAQNTLQRFWRFVEINADGCWQWTGAIRSGTSGNGGGYANFHAIDHTGARHRYAHRFAYSAFRAAIPRKMDMDHLCRNRACCNPDHLEVVTHRENIRRGEGPVGENGAKTHCKRGHPFDEANTWRDKNGGRYCRACHAARQMVRNHRLRGPPRRAKR
jgi:HNH endonuclease